MMQWRFLVFIQNSEVKMREASTRYTYTYNKFDNESIIGADMGNPCALCMGGAINQNHHQCQPAPLYKVLTNNFVQSIDMY